MKSLLLITLLAAAVTASLDGYEDPSPMVPATLDELENGYELDEDGIPLEIVPESRASLILGTITSDDRLVARITHSVAAATFLIHDQDVTFRGAPYTNITAIRVARIGNTTNAVPSIRAGGLRHEYVTIRIRGVRNRGFDYLISIYASINCSNS